MTLLIALFLATNSALVWLALLVRMQRERLAELAERVAILEGEDPDQGPYRTPGLPSGGRGEIQLEKPDGGASIQITASDNSVVSNVRIKGSPSHR